MLCQLDKSDSKRPAKTYLVVSPVCYVYFCSDLLRFSQHGISSIIMTEISRPACNADFDYFSDVLSVKIFKKPVYEHMLVQVIRKFEYPEKVRLQPTKSTV